MPDWNVRGAPKAHKKMVFSTKTTMAGATRAANQQTAKMTARDAAKTPTA